jgi:septal ring factor EnvC (AmiA/AmiB activator)
MTKEEVLQKANDYCNEKSYNESTLTPEFKDKFAVFFSKKYPETNADDETMIADLKFNLDTAFSATSRGITSKQKAFDDKETELKNQIAELTKKLGKKQDDDPKLSKEIQEKLDRLERFEVENRKKDKFAEVIGLAKKGVRDDLAKSFETFASDFEVSLDQSSEEQAKKLTDRFQEIFKDTIGDIKPLAPKVVQKREEEFFDSLPKIKI